MEKNCVFFVGFPGSGKSTKIKEILKEKSDACVISVDDYIEKKAQEQGKKYNDVYREFNEAASKNASAKSREAMNNGAFILWDQTNLSSTARIKRVKQLKEKGYDVFCYFFNLSEQELEKRLNKRVSEGEKNISTKVINYLRESYSPPSYSEGFDKIFIIDDFNNELLLDKEQSIKELNDKFISACKNRNIKAISEYVSNHFGFNADIHINNNECLINAFKDKDEEVIKILIGNSPDMETCKNLFNQYKNNFESDFKEQISKTIMVRERKKQSKSNKNKNKI